MSATARKARFSARLRPADKKLLERAADLSSRKLTDFVLSSAKEAALETIERYEAMTLVDKRDRMAFVDALLKPRAPSKRLRAAAKRYKEASST